MSQQINLLNPAFVKQRKHFLLPAMLQNLGLIVVGALAFSGYAAYQVDRLEKQVKEDAGRYDAEQARLVRLAGEFSPQQATQALQQEVRQLEKRASDQAELIGMIKSGAIGNTAGYSVYMRAFARQVVQGLWLTAFRVTGDGTQIRLDGAVVDPGLLPEYIQRLNKESIMRGKAFAMLQMRQPKAAGTEGGAGRGELPRYVEFTLRSGSESEGVK